MDGEGSAERGSFRSGTTDAFPAGLLFAAAGLPQGAVIILLFRDRLGVVLDRRERRCVRVCAFPCSSGAFFLRWEFRRDLPGSGISRRMQIGRASCRERVTSSV